MNIERLTGRRKIVISCAVIALVATSLVACGQDRSTHAEGEGKPMDALSNNQTTTVVTDHSHGHTHGVEGDVDFENASRGFLGKIEGTEILNLDGSVSVDLTAFENLDGEAPDSVNSALWRHAKLSNIRGLFEVVPGIYQLRGYDVAVMTLIEGKTGWIVIDPLMTEAPSRAGLELANQLLGRRPVSAIIFTHSHEDHYGGVGGVLPPEGERDNIDVIAPEGFFEAVITENLLAYNHTLLRTQYHAGIGLGNGPELSMGNGLSLAISNGPRAIYKPTLEIGDQLKTMKVDGVEIVFMNANETEAVSEFIFYFPEHKVLHSAEVVTGVMHNTLTLRGAKARDTLRWSKVIDSMLTEFGEEAIVMIGSHHHPVFGNEAVRTKLRNHRNLYRYLHDQTLRMANNGMTMHEIANSLPEPTVMSRDLSTRGHYGDLSHNSRAVYQFYYGWWDGVPANMNPLSPEKHGRRFVDAIGGEEKALEIGAAAIKEGDYLWAATVLNHVLFAENAKVDPRELLAKAYRALGFATESAIVRNYYLLAAKELEEGRVKLFYPLGKDNLPVEYFGDYLAIRYNPEKFEHTPFVMTVSLPDIDAVLSLDVDEDVLFPRVGEMPRADYFLETNYENLEAWERGDLPSSAISDKDEVIAALDAILTSLDTFSTDVNFIQP